MTVSPINPEPPIDAPTATTQAPAMPASPQGIYTLPVVGPQLQRVRNVADGLQPTEDDNIARVAAKRVLQGCVITGGAAVLALAVL